MTSAGRGPGENSEADHETSCSFFSFIRSHPYGTFTRHATVVAPGPVGLQHQAWDGLDLLPEKGYLRLLDVR